MCGRREREIEKELRFHIENQIEENLRAGMAPMQARRQAILMFGGPSQIREECRELRPLHWAGTLWADLRYVVRSLLASPVFTFTEIVSIALGIGANAAIFTLVHAALLKPLPVPRPGDLFHAIRSDSVEQTWSYSWPGRRSHAVVFGNNQAAGSGGYGQSTEIFAGDVLTAGDPDLSVDRHVAISRR